MTNRLSILLILGFGLAGCGGSTPTVSGPSPVTPPPSSTTTVTFSSIQRDIFETAGANGRAACTSCHTSAGRSPAGALDLGHAAAYDELVNVQSRAMSSFMRVVPGDPDRSYLVQTVEGSSAIVSRRMPINGPYLSDSEIAMLKQWISQGALRN